MRKELKNIKNDLRDLQKIVKFVAIDCTQHAARLSLALFFSLFCFSFSFSAEDNSKENRDPQSVFYISDGTVLEGANETVMIGKKLQEKSLSNKNFVFDVGQDYVFVEKGTIVVRKDPNEKENQKSFLNNFSKLTSFQKNSPNHQPSLKDNQKSLFFKNTPSDKYFSLGKEQIVSGSVTHYRYDLKNTDYYKFIKTSEYCYSNTQFYYSIQDVVAYKRKLSIRPPPVVIS